MMKCRKCGNRNGPDLVAVCTCKQDEIYENLRAENHALLKTIHGLEMDLGGKSWNYNEDRWIILHGEALEAVQHCVKRLDHAVACAAKKHKGSNHPQAKCIPIDRKYVDEASQALGLSEVYIPNSNASGEPANPTDKPTDRKVCESVVELDDGICELCYHDEACHPKPPCGTCDGAKRLLARNQQCGCVICYCENQNQCQGCGAKYCDKHRDGIGGDIPRNFVRCPFCHGKGVE